MGFIIPSRTAGVLAHYSCIFTLVRNTHCHFAQYIYIYEAFKGHYSYLQGSFWPLFYWYRVAFQPHPENLYEKGVLGYQPHKN